MKRWILILIVALFLLVVFLIIYNLPKDISEIKKEEFIGKTVRINGEVRGVIKIGSLSGFILEDKTGTIGVSSTNLPKEGEIISVKGILLKDSLFGYYLKVQ